MVKLKAQLIFDQDRRFTKFELFQQWSFEDKYQHVVFVLSDRGVYVAVAYAWNLDSVGEAETVDHVELALVEAEPKGQGHGSMLVNALKERYGQIAVYGSENDRFWEKHSFNHVTRSMVTGERIMEWRRER